MTTPEFYTRRTATCLMCGGQMHARKGRVTCSVVCRMRRYRKRLRKLQNGGGSALPDDPDQQWLPFEHPPVCQCEACLETADAARHNTLMPERPQMAAIS